MKNADFANGKNLFKKGIDHWTFVPKLFKPKNLFYKLYNLKPKCLNISGTVKIHYI